MILGENELVFAKVRQGAIIPSKREEDAAYDVYPCFEEDYIVIPAHTTKLIPTGIASALNPKYYIQIEERGSTGSRGIKKSAGVIDSGYRNEWFIAISNINKKDLIISKLTMDEIKLKYGMMDECGNSYIVDRDNNMIWLYSNHTILYPYEKAISQAIVHEVPQMNVTEVTYQDLLTINSERGLGALGSSCK